MGTISKFSGKDIADVNKIDGVDKSSIAKFAGQDIPSTSRLLDTYTGSSIAYSVRLLNSSYTGACMRIREGSGNTETDIGFDSNGYIDTAAIASHCGSATGYVTKWYSQSTSGGTGSGNDAVQTTSSQQPQIYNGTSVYTDNSIAAIRVPNSANGSIGLDIQSNLRTSLGASSIFTVHNIDQQHTGFQRIYTFYKVQQYALTTSTHTNYADFSIGDSGGVASDRRYVRFNDSTRLQQKVRTAIYDGSSTTSGGKPDIEFRINGVEDTTPIDGNAGFYVPASGENSIMYRMQNNTQGIIGYMQEVIVFLSDESTDRAAIESDIETYYSIT